jgi:hypothetical protein
MNRFVESHNNKKFIKNKNMQRNQDHASSMHNDLIASKKRTRHVSLCIIKHP